MIEDFIYFVNKNCIPLTSSIVRSTFETNSMLIEKKPNMIEYAAFFGSIQIVKYLEVNSVELTQSLSLYSVHSNNSELIQFLEEKNVEIDDTTFSEAVKCHHNDIAHYIQQNHLKQGHLVSSIFVNDNYEFFPYELDGNDAFFGLCEGNYTKLVNHYLSMKKEEIESYISKNGGTNDIQNLVVTALKEDRHDVAYYSMSKLTQIPEQFFNKVVGISRVVIPPSVTSIGVGIFSCCGFRQIILPPSLTSIQRASFYGSTLIETMTIPSSVTSYEESVFIYCKRLKNITINPCQTKGTYYCDNMFLVHRTDLKNDFYDELVWARPVQSMNKVTVPPFIKIVGHTSFY